MLKAIKNAFCNLTKPPLTHAYPPTPSKKPKDYRGIIGYNTQHCMFCEKVDSNDAIVGFSHSQNRNSKDNFLHHFFLRVNTFYNCTKEGKARVKSLL